MQNQLKNFILFCGIICGLNAFSQGENCATAIPALIGINTSNGPSTGTGADNICGFGTPANNADWYQWTAPSNVSVIVSSCLGGADTRVSISAGSCGVEACVASNDDFCELAQGGEAFASYVNFAATAGVTYYIQWDDRWSTAGFDWTLTTVSENCPELGLNVGDACDNIGDGDGIVSNACLCVEPPNPDCPILVSPADGAIDVMLTGVNLDAVVMIWTNSLSANGVYWGTDPEELVLRISGSSNITGWELSGFEKGITYYWSVIPSILIGQNAGCPIYSFTVAGDVDCPSLGLNGLNFGNSCDDGDPNTGNDVVSEDACVCAGTPTPSNAYCTAATSIIPGIYTDNMIAGGDGSLDLCFADDMGANALWFEYTPACSGNVTISSAIDLDYPDTRLSVYSGGCFAPVCIASNDDDGAGKTSLLTFPAIAGTSYLIAWDDRWSTTAFDFEVSTLCDFIDSDFDGTPDLYDNCVNNYNPLQLDYDMDGLGDVCDDDDDNDGDLDAVDCEILDNTIFFGADCDDLDATTGNDMIQSNCTCLGFPLTGNATCNNAAIIEEGIVIGAMINGGDGAINDCFPSGGTDALWYSYTAPADGDVTVNSTIDADEPDTRVSIYSGACLALTCVAFNDDQEEVFSSKVSFPATSGTTYFIEWDDRWGNEEFDFEISFESSTPCPTDLNFDGTTNGVDFSIFLGNFALSCGDCGTDFNSNGFTDGEDFSLFLGNFGLDCE